MARDVADELLVRRGQLERLAVAAGDLPLALVRRRQADDHHGGVGLLDLRAADRRRARRSRWR